MVATAEQDAESADAALPAILAARNRNISGLEEQVRNRIAQNEVLQAKLARCQSQLAVCQAQLAVCQALLATCQAQLAKCQAAKQQSAAQKPDSDAAPVEPRWRHPAPGAIYTGTGKTIAGNEVTTWLSADHKFVDWVDSAYVSVSWLPLDYDVDLRSPAMQAAQANARRWLADKNELAGSSEYMAAMLERKKRAWKAAEKQLVVIIRARNQKIAELETQLAELGSRLAACEER